MDGRLTNASFKGNNGIQSTFRTMSSKPPWKQADTLDRSFVWSPWKDSLR